MKVNIYINDNLYKTLDVLGETYDPRFVYPIIEADREAGLLTQFGIENGLSVKIEKVQE